MTADYLEAKLRERDVPLLRLDTDSMLPRTSFGFDGSEVTLSVDGARYTPGHFSSVWYRRPARLKDPRLACPPEESKFILDEWSEALEGFFAQIERPKWMNHPSANAAASHKVEQLMRAKAVGLRVPDTLVTQSPSALREFHGRHGGRVIVKPMADGAVERADGERISIVYTNRVTDDQLANLDDVATCPTLFQEEVAKESDVRITIVDDHIHAVELLAADADGVQRCDIRRNNMADVSYRVVTVPEQTTRAIRTLMAQYGLRFGAIDMATTREGEWVFFEVNPNGQWAWLDLVGATTIADSFVSSFKGGLCPASRA